MLDDEPVLTCPMLADLGYLEAIHSLFEVCVLKKFPKQTTVWFHGFANTGKTTLINLVSKIFICDSLEEG